MNRWVNPCTNPNPQVNGNTGPEVPHVAPPNSLRSGATRLIYSHLLLINDCCDVKGDAQEFESLWVSWCLPIALEHNITLITAGILA